MEKKSVLSNWYLYGHDQYTTQNGNKQWSAHLHATCPDLQDCVVFLILQRKKWDTGRVILRFSKIPSDLHHLGVWMLSARHLNITYPNFHKKSESRFPDSVPSVLTDLVGTDASQNGSLGLQDWLGLSSLKIPLNYTTVWAKSSQLHQGGWEGAYTHGCTFTPSLKDTFLQNNVKCLKEFSLTKTHFLKITYQNDFRITHCAVPFSRCCFQMPL